MALTGGARRKSPQLSSVTSNEGAAGGPEPGPARTAHDRTVFHWGGGGGGGAGGEGKAKYSLFNLFSCLQDELLYRTTGGGSKPTRGQPTDRGRRARGGPRDQ